MPPQELEAIRARDRRAKAKYGSTWDGLALSAEKDREALLAEVERLGARWKSSQLGVGELIDRAENVEYQHEKATTEIATLNAALDRVVNAAEDVLAEAEQAETEAVFSGAADPARLGTPALKALREAILTLPAADTTPTPKEN
jgi:ABC-type transporter Mla subunit MlaD